VRSYRPGISVANQPCRAVAIGISANGFFHLIIEVATPGQGHFPGVAPETGQQSITPIVQRTAAMAIEKDIIKLLKAEGLKINENIRDALDEFIEVVKEEGETSEENAETEEKLAKDDDS
jgi:hypothetical protein